MHYEPPDPWQHEHVFVDRTPSHGERRLRWVILLTLVMMIGEIAGGMLFGSMALLADGWHMGTHAAALGIAVWAYWFARRHADDPRFSFGTGKVSSLGGFASAVGLAVVALLVFAESAWRLLEPVEIRFDQAIAVAVLGLLVNLFSAWLLREQPHHHHGHEHPHTHEHRDHNLRGAYLHVLADALTSLTAIFALLTGKWLDWTWMDPLMGVLGSLVIARWSWGLLRETSGVLLDAELDPDRLEYIRRQLEGEGGDRVSDLHVWRIGPRHLAAAVTLVCSAPRGPEHYKQRLAELTDLVHVTIEVHRGPQPNGQTRKTLSF